MFPYRVIVVASALSFARPDELSLLEPLPSPAPVPSSMMEQAQKYLGSRCDSATAAGCNPLQLPLFDSSSFVPHRLAAVAPSSVFVDGTEKVTKDNMVDIDESASSVASTASKGFGISAAVPFRGIMFSLGLQFQDLAAHMHTDNSLNYYSEVSRTYTVFTASLNNTITLLPEVTQAVAALPASCASPSDEQKWFAFFAKYGTHYVKSVSFGGIMKM